MAYQYLHKKPAKEPIDYLVYFFVFATPLFEIPQAIAIYSHHSADNVSIWTWAFFFLSSIAWIIYGIRNRLLPIIITYCLYLAIESTIVAGIILYS